MYFLFKSLNPCWESLSVYLPLLLEDLVLWLPPPPPPSSSLFSEMKWKREIASHPLFLPKLTLVEYIVLFLSIVPYSHSLRPFHINIDNID